MDVLVIETLNGGDILVKGNDLVSAKGFENMPYLAMFGGNIEGSTPTVRVAGELNKDWWGNSFITSRPAQANSDTERKMMTEPLTSSGRVRIENTVKNDLKFMRNFADVSVSVSILNDDVIGIRVRIVEPQNIQAKEFQYIWDGARLSLTGSGIDYEAPPVTQLAYRILESGAYRLLENGGRRLLES